MFKVLAHGATHVGRERKNNEDAFRIAEEAGLFLVCDGMGGHASGEVASQIAADALVRSVSIDRFRSDYRWPADTQVMMTDEARALDAAVRTANVEVFRAATSNPSHKGMGTTIVAMLAGSHRLALVHVGDSRIYRLRGKEFDQLTDDHSLLNHYMRTRPMSAEQIRSFAGKNVIVRAVGLREGVEPDVQVVDYRRGDLYVLCSDGLSDMVDDEPIALALKEYRNDLRAAADALIELALRGGGKDNISVVLAEIVEIPDQGRIDLAARSTLSMETTGEHDPLEDTSPGFDTADVALENTLTEGDATVLNPLPPRKFGSTQQIKRRPEANESQVVYGDAPKVGGKMAFKTTSEFVAENDPVHDSGPTLPHVRPTDNDTRRDLQAMPDEDNLDDVTSPAPRREAPSGVQVASPEGPLSPVPVHHPMVNEPTERMRVPVVPIDERKDDE